MSSSLVITSTNPASLVTLSAGDKIARMSKKEFYAANGIDSLGRGEKERRYAAYAATFSTALVEAIKGFSDYQHKSTKKSKNGKQILITLDLKQVDPVDTQKQLADALKELAALKAEKAANANAEPAYVRSA